MEEEEEEEEEIVFPGTNFLAVADIAQVSLKRELRARGPAGGSRR